MSIYSKPATQAIRILTQMAEQNGERDVPFTVRDVALATDISEPTVAKILQTLAKGGVLDSRKGPGGGFRLALSPKNITLFQVVSAIEGENVFSDCLGGLPLCSDEEPCPLHEKWRVVKEGLIRFLRSTSLHELVTVMRRRQRAVKAGV